MGYSISWIAFQGLTKSQILSRIQVIDTAEPDEANESPISGSELPGGWYVLFLNDVTHPYLSDAGLRELSTGCSVLGCQVEEHVMVSASLFYQNGTQIWKVVHDSEKGIYHLQIDGDPPESLSISECRQKQDSAGGEGTGVDYIFDAPLELARRLCGYRHDRWKFDWGQPKFTRLVTDGGS